MRRLLRLGLTRRSRAAHTAVASDGDAPREPPRAAADRVAPLRRHVRQGRYQGAGSFTWGLGLVLGPSAGTALYAGRPGALWPACLALGILSAGLMLLGPARRVQPSPAHAAEADPGMAR